MPWYALDERHTDKDGGKFCETVSAADFGQVDCFRKLLLSGADPWILVQRGAWNGTVSLLMIATFSRRPEIVSFVLHATASQGKVIPSNYCKSTYECYPFLQA